MTNDVMDGLYEVHKAFRAAGLNPPAAIILKTPEDGSRFLAAINGKNLMYVSGSIDALKPIEHPDGSVWMQLKFMDFDVRWPASKFATESGYVWA